MKSLLPCSNLIQLVAKILALCAPMLNRNMENVLEERERVALFLCQAKREYSKLVSQEVFSLLQGEANQDMEIFSVPQNILQCPLLVSTILPTLELTYLLISATTDYFCLFLNFI